MLCISGSQKVLEELPLSSGPERQLACMEMACQGFKGRLMRNLKTLEQVTWKQCNTDRPYDAGVLMATWQRRGVLCWRSGDRAGTLLAERMKLTGRLF